VEYLLLAVLAGGVSMDTTEGPQLMVSEPIVSCTAAGLLFGNAAAGLALGLLFQMIWIGYLPLGAARFYDSNMGSLIGASSLLAAWRGGEFSGTMLAAGFIPALLYGLWVSYIGIYIIHEGRKVNGNRTERFLSLLEWKQEHRVGRFHLAGVARAFLRGALMAAILVPPGIVLCRGAALLGPKWIAAANHAAHFAAGIAAATVIAFYLTRNRYVWLSAGAAGGVLWVLSR
jgi:PTS system mannose-specific IIC component